MNRRWRWVAGVATLFIAASALAIPAYRSHRRSVHIRTLIGGLSQDMGGLRATELKSMGQEAVPFLMAAAPTPDGFFAVRILGEMSATETIEPLLDLYRQDEQGYAAVPAAMKTMGPPGAAAVLERLRRGQPEFIWFAGNLCGPEATPHLAKFAAVPGQSDEYYERCATALGETGDPAAAEPLVALLGRSSEVDGYARYALVLLGTGAGPACARALQTEKREAVLNLLMSVVAEAGMKDAAPVLAQFVGGADGPWNDRRRGAFFALCRLPDTGQADLFWHLLRRFPNDGNERYAAAIGLGNAGDARAEPLIRQYYKEMTAIWSPSVPCEAMARCRSEASLDFLLSLLEKHQGDPGQQRHVLKALGYCQSARAAQAVHTWLKAHMPAPESRGGQGAALDMCLENAVGSLGGLGYVEALPELRTLLNVRVHSICGRDDPNYPYRNFAANAIGDIERAKTPR